MQRVFLSHSSSDKEFVRMLNASFQVVGVDTFLDEKDILIGQSIPESVYKGIDEATHLIYVISEKSVSSKWVNEELSIAKMKEKSSDGFFILPILLDPVTLPIAIAHIKYADFTSWRSSEAYREAFLSILVSLGIEPKVIGGEELRWYAENSGELRTCLRWLSRSIWAIDGGLTASQSVDSEAHYMPTKFAFEDGLQSDLEAIASLIPSDASSRGRISSLAYSVQDALVFIKAELNSRTQYKDFNKISMLVRKLKNILEVLEQFRSETETILLSGVNMEKK